MVDWLLQPTPWLVSGAVFLLGLILLLAVWTFESHSRCKEDALNSGRKTNPKD